jgi:E3 ubiquitin-protein ligase SHPRH
VLWRTAKNDVLDEICLPPQTIEVHWLTFSPVEEHFYRKHYQECAHEAMQKLCTWTDNRIKLDTLDKYTLHQLMTPLVRVRQACCHPQVVRGHYLPIQNRTMTMVEVLSHLINKTRVECEEAHRRMVFASTGLAGLHIINNEYVKAVEEYRSMLHSVNEHRGEVRTDLLQVLHIVHNLHEILQLKPAGVGHTLMDSELEQQEKEIQGSYLSKSAAFVSTARDAWMVHRKTVVDLRTQLIDNMDWWADLLQWAIFSHLDDRLVEEVKGCLVENVDNDHPNMANKFQSVRGLQYVLSDQVDQLDTLRATVVEQLEQLTSTDPQHFVDSVVDCCLRPAVQQHAHKPEHLLCAFCLADKHLTKYEGKLFFCVQKGMCEVDETTDQSTSQVSTRQQVTWADSETEKAFKAIINFAKNFAGDKEAVEFGILNLKLFEALKKEFRCLRPVWMSLRERVCAIDEMRMAITRMRLREPNEPICDPPLANVIDLSEFEVRQFKFSSDKIIARNELSRKKGQLRYLNSLSKSQNGLDSLHNLDPCPVCNQKLTTRWSVLQCGHCYCLSCMDMLIDHYSGTSGTSPSKNHRCLTCAVCRQTTLYSDISFVTLRQKDDTDSRPDDADIEVKGDHSTKIEGVVRCLLKIQRSDKDAKALVFSTWTEVLNILADALTDNNINFRMLQASRKFEEHLESFKNNPEVQVLLLPIHSGSNGLNLIEATHVLLVEPVLNTTQELQAIGRVHRIGQTRPTVVHRFLVRGTIEVRMFNLLQAVNAPHECHSAEDTSLTIGDLNKLFEIM